MRLFQTTSAVFPHLKSIRVDGEVSQRVFCTLLKLPALRELTLWRVCEARDPLSNFHGLRRLRVLEIGMLSIEEALPFGDAVRDNTLETLHIDSADLDMRARLDRFDLNNVHEGFISRYTCQKLKVLVLKPQLTWSFGLLPQSGDQLSHSTCSGYTLFF